MTMLCLRLIATVFVINAALAVNNDLTLQLKATGQDVVEAVITKIKNANIFKPDNEFLLRIAYVESKFGKAPGTFRKGYYGGIWQIDQAGFEETKAIKSNSKGLAKNLKRVQEEFGIDWMEVKYEDLEKPLYSGLAARLLLSNIKSPIPETLEAQAAYWKDHYNSHHPNAKGTPEKFIEDIEEHEKKIACKSKMDLVIGLDGSGSIGHSTFESAKQSVIQFVSKFSMETTRIGMIVYSDSAVVRFPLNNSFGNNRAEMNKAISDTYYPNSGTRTDLAIREAISLLTPDTSQQSEFPRIMAIFTDGKSNEPVEEVARGAKDVGIVSFAIGIGPEIDHNELAIISGGNENNVISVSSFQTLNSRVSSLTKRSCAVPYRPQIDSTVSDVLSKDEKRYYDLVLPKEGLTVSIKSNTGSTRGFFAFDIESPSSALNDGEIIGSTFIPNVFSGLEKKSEKLVKIHKRSVSLSAGDENVQANRSEKDNEGSRKGVFICIVGLGEENNYTLRSTEGDLSGSTSDYFLITLCFICFSFVLVFITCCFTRVRNKLKTYI